MKRSVNGHALGRFDDGTSVFVGLVVGERVLRLQADEIVPGPATINTLLEHWPAAQTGLAELARHADPGRGIQLEDLRILAPVEPRQILQAGANYRSHVAEIIVSGREPDDPRSDEELRQFAETLMDERARSGSPFFFSGAITALCGPDDDVLLPPESSKVDWEAELAVVIGTPAHRVSPEQALDHIAGYTICNDVSARDLQFPAEHRPLGGDWIRAKNRPTFLPTGPFLVPADQIGDYRDLEISFRLNGRQLQRDVARNMLFNLATLIASASAALPLLPGDLLLTGSPAGNGGHWDRWLRPGDIMESAITGLGAQHNTCVPENL